MATINSSGIFTLRPPLESEYLSPEGERVTVGATWPSGVVFKEGSSCSATELMTQYTPINESVLRGMVL